MAIQEYKITFKDGTTQTLPTPGPQLEREWFVFRDGIGVQACVRAEEVEDIVRVGTPERSSANPKAA
ncbi:MAG TPA: hypothetical protein VG253_25850 [Streptosporangiaceae bacterium]|nr:hypothetical protein [Streptosporangiaceae bacterium]